MTDPLKVLVWGTATEGPCAYFRGYMYDEPLRELGVEMRHISKLNFKPAKGWEEKPLLEVVQAGKLELDTSDIEWSDVLVMRRYYNTAMVCAAKGGIEDQGCGFYTLDEEVGKAHPHGMKRQDDITRWIWPAIRDTYGGGLLYETDDNHFAIKDWNGYYKAVVLERDLITDMARRADLITVSTPQLVQTYGRFGPNIRVVRNSIDPELYVRDRPKRESDKQRLVYYGSTARMRDYAGYPDARGKWEGGFARAAVEANAHRLTRVFLGTNPGTEPIIAKMFDEQTPYITGIAAFSKALTESDGDIGIAPLGGDDFDRCKSELHWLEYAMADMAMVGERFNGTNGPYNMIRPGVDGLLARGRGEWHDAVTKLAKNPNMTRDIAAAAKERVLAEYDYRLRAKEWADAFRWAAENAGIGKKVSVAA